MAIKLDRRTFIKTMGAGAASLTMLGQGCAWSAPNVMKRSRPNILFINVDQLNASALSGNGCPHVATPNMDRLMGRGVSFFAILYDQSGLLSGAERLVQRAAFERDGSAGQYSSTGGIARSRPVDERPGL